MQDIRRLTIPVDRGYMDGDTKVERTTWFEAVSGSRSRDAALNMEADLPRCARAAQR